MFVCVAASLACWRDDQFILTAAVASHAFCTSASHFHSTVQHFGLDWLPNGLPAALRRSHRRRQTSGKSFSSIVFVISLLICSAQSVYLPINIRLHHRWRTFSIWHYQVLPHIDTKYERCWIRNNSEYGWENWIKLSIDEVFYLLVSVCGYL